MAENEKTKRSSPISEEQKKLMVEFLKNHKELTSGKFSQQFSKQESIKLWEELTIILNSIPGPKKTYKDWRKVSTCLSNYSLKISPLMAYWKFFFKPLI